MYTPRVRVFLIAIAVAGGMLFLPTQPHVAYALFFSVVLFIIGYFRSGTVWLAFRAFRKGQVDRAGRLINHIPYPDWLSAQFQAYYHWMRGTMELQAHQPKAAVEHLQRSFEGRLRTSNARSGVAATMVQAWIEIGDLDQAKAALSMARELTHNESTDRLLGVFDERISQLRDPALYEPVRIEGKLVHLRDFSPEDIEALVRWWTTERAWMDWDAPWEEEPANEEKSRREWEYKLARPPFLPRGRLLICLPDNTPVGRVNLYGIDHNPDRPALGIDIHESRFWGQGLGTQAFALWAEYVFREHQPDRLFCETWSGNEKMLRIAARLGFKEVRRRRNLRQVRGKSYDALRLKAERSDFMRSFVELGIPRPE